MDDYLYTGVFGVGFICHPCVGGDPGLPSICKEIHCLSPDGRLLDIGCNLLKNPYNRALLRILIRRMEKKEYLTQEKYDQLQDELQDLKTNKRKEVAEHLEHARSLGDLSENAEYHEAREQQAQTEARIIQLETILKNAQIVKHTTGETVEVGSQVTVIKNGESNQTIFTLVGSEEADISLGKISHHSPLGAALFGKKKGQSFEFESPKGTVKYTIISVK